MEKQTYVIISTKNSNWENHQVLGLVVSAYPRRVEPIALLSGPVEILGHINHSKFVWHHMFEEGEILHVFQLKIRKLRPTDEILPFTKPKD